MHANKNNLKLYLRADNGKQKLYLYEKHKTFCCPVLHSNAFCSV